MRIDRNALAGNRTRRNWQRLDVSTATTAIQLNPASNNALISTGQGYAVFVDSTGGIQNTSEGLSLDFTGEGSLLTIDSTGAVTYLAAGSVGQVLTISSTTSTELSWQTPSTSGGGGSTTIVYNLDPSISTSTNSNSTGIMVVDSPYISTSSSTQSTTHGGAISTYSDGLGIQLETKRNVATYQNLSGLQILPFYSTSSIVYSTGGLSLLVPSGQPLTLEPNIGLVFSANNPLVPGGNSLNLAYNLNQFNLNSTGELNIIGVPTSTFASTGIAVSTSGLSTWITNTDPGSTFYVIGSTGIATSTVGTSTWVTNTSTGSGGSTAVLPVVSSNPGSPTAGQAWYNSTTGLPYITLANDGVNTAIGVVPGAILGQVSLTASTTASTGIRTFPGTSITLPVGFLNQPNTILPISLVITATATVANTFTYYLTIGSTTNAIYTTSALTTGQTSEVQINGPILVFATGTSGHVAFRGAGFQSIAGTATAAYGTATWNPINLTSTIAFSVGVSAATTQASDIITLYSIVLGQQY